MQTKFLLDLMICSFDKTLLSISCFPGHQSPGTSEHCGAADSKRIGRPVSLATSKPWAISVYH